MLKVMTKQDVKIQPLGARVLIAPREVEEKTAGGLIVPPTAQEDKKPEVGIVVKLGTGENEKGEKVEFKVKVGDTVFFKRYSPEEIEVEGKKYFILDYADILAVM